jgi:hypothetical protein
MESCGRVALGLGESFDPVVGPRGHGEFGKCVDRKRNPAKKSRVQKSFICKWPKSRGKRSSPESQSRIEQSGGSADF